MKLTLVGNELLRVTPRLADGSASPMSELTTTQAIADLLAGSVAAETIRAEAAEALLLANLAGVTPQMFGAVGNGVADDTAAVSAWLASGKPLRLSSGRFKITSMVTATLPANTSLSMIGSARHQAEFLLSAPTAGITINVTSAPDDFTTPQVIIEKISIVPDAQIAGPALTIAFPAGAGGREDPRLRIDGLYIMPSTVHNYATTGLKLVNCSLCDVNDVLVLGNYGGYIAGSMAIDYNGGSIPVDSTFTRIRAYWMDTGLAISGTWQGVSLSSSAFVAVRVGVSAIGDNNDEMWLRVFDSVFDATDYGVQSINIANVKVYNNLIYTRNHGASLSANPAGVFASMTSNVTMYALIQGNDFQDYTSTSHIGHYAVDLNGPGTAGTSASTISGNTFLTYDYAINLRSGTNKVHVGHNDYEQMITANIFNAGTNNTMAPAPVALVAGAQVGN